MEAVLTLLANSADQSQIMAQMEGDGQASGIAGSGEEEDDVVWHKGKKYTRVQIEGLGKDQEYLMNEETGDIYTLDFQFYTNMNDNLVIEDDN